MPSKSKYPVDSPFYSEFTGIRYEDTKGLWLVRKQEKGRLPDGTIQSKQVNIGRRSTKAEAKLLLDAHNLAIARGANVHDKAQYRQLLKECETELHTNEPATKPVIGKYYLSMPGRPPLDDEIKHRAIVLLECGMKPKNIQRELGIGKTSFYRIIKQFRSS
jgi:hypothetical protein